MSSKVVIVTGCSKGGIGYALCEEFAAHGCKVYATARRVETMQDLNHPDITRLKLDVTSGEEIHSVVESVFSKERRIDILVNNAGAPCTGPLMEIDISRAKKTFDTNVIAALSLAQAVFPHMVAERRGTIVNIGSIAGDTPSPWGGIYGATKAALVRLSEILYMEVAPFNIHVVHVSPGGVKTNIGTNALSGLSLRDDSIYKPWYDSMITRVNRSQGPSSPKAEQFAKEVVREVMKDSPPRYMTLGAGVWVNSVLQWLPRAFVCWLMWKLVAGHSAPV